jgi:hypothetical protein
VNSDIGPGMRKLIDKLEAVEGDYVEHIPLPNGYHVSIVRTQPTEVTIPDGLPTRRDGKRSMLIGGTYGAAAGLFEMALWDSRDNMVRDPVGWCSPVDVARKLREWFELPEKSR